MKQTIEEVVGNNVRRLRKELGWSQDKLKEKSGVSQRVISNIERGGAAGSSTMGIIDQICAGLGVPTFLIMTEGLATDKEKIKRMATLMKSFSSLSDRAQQRIIDLVDDYKSMDNGNE